MENKKFSNDDVAMPDSPTGSNFSTAANHSTKSHGALIGIIALIVAALAGYVAYMFWQQQLLEIDPAISTQESLEGVLYFSAGKHNTDSDIVNKSQIHTYDFVDGKIDQVTMGVGYSGLTATIDENYEYAYWIMDVNRQVSSDDSDGINVVQADVSKPSDAAFAYDLTPGFFEREVEGSLEASSIAFMRVPESHVMEGLGDLSDIANWETIRLEPRGDGEVAIPAAVSPVWGYDGHSLYVLKQDGIYHYPIHSHNNEDEPVRISPEIEMRFVATDRLAYSPVTKQLAATKVGKSLQMYQVGNDGRQLVALGDKLLAPSGYVWHTPVFSPDGDKLAVVQQPINTQVDDVAIIKIFAADTMNEVSSQVLLGYDPLAVELDEWLTNEILHLPISN